MEWNGTVLWPGLVVCGLLGVMFLLPTMQILLVLVQVYLAFVRRDTYEVYGHRRIEQFGDEHVLGYHEQRLMGIVQRLSEIEQRMSYVGTNARSSRKVVRED